MKNRFWIALILLIFSACSEKKESGELRVEVPWPKSDGSYAFREVKLRNVDSLKPFRGRYADFKVSPKVTKTEFSGPSVEVHYLRDDDLLVPRDDLSAEALTIYAHMQGLFDLDRSIGIHQQLRWPRPIGLRVFTRNEQGNLDKNNAFYFGGLDVMLIVPYTNNSVAISMNAGILAHEHFHAIWNRFVNDSSSIGVHQDLTSGEEPSPTFNIGDRQRGDIEAKIESLSSDEIAYYNRTLLRGMNEGFADFWGWLYTRDIRFIERSGFRGVDHRILKSEIPALISMRSMVRFLNIREGVNQDAGFAYSNIAISYSRFLKQLADVMQKQKPEINGGIEVAKLLVQSLTRLGAARTQQLETSLMSPELPLETLLGAIELNPEICELVKQVDPAGKIDTKGCNRVVEP